jgi:hypothetical protein
MTVDHLNKPHTFEDFFSQFRGRLGKRAVTFAFALEHISSRGPVNIVETGCLRMPGNWSGDGCSSALFASFIQAFGGTLTSIDIDPAACAECRRQTERYSVDNEVIEGDSIIALTEIASSGGKIDLLYLDSYDFDASSPQGSQGHSLAEAQAAQDAVVDDGVILIDDVGLTHRGKGGMSIPWLESVGWEQVVRGYQVALMRKT